jgi:hypothetical protein
LILLIQCADLNSRHGKLCPVILSQLRAVRLANLSRGQSATLLVDAEQQVTNVSFNRTDKSTPRER